MTPVMNGRLVVLVGVSAALVAILAFLGIPSLHDLLRLMQDVAERSVRVWQVALAAVLTAGVFLVVVAAWLRWESLPVADQRGTMLAGVCAIGLATAGVILFALTPGGVASQPAAEASLSILHPIDGDIVECPTDGPCLIGVQVHWVVSDAATDRRNVVVLVRPKPGQSYPYYVQPFPTPGRKGVWTAQGVGLGDNDPRGTPYLICAVATLDLVPASAQLPTLPTGSTTCVEVTRS